MPSMAAQGEESAIITKHKAVSSRGASPAFIRRLGMRPNGHRRRGTGGVAVGAAVAAEIGRAKALAERETKSVILPVTCGRQGVEALTGTGAVLSGSIRMAYTVGVANFLAKGALPP